jgi:hypothetical protein
MIEFEPNSNCLVFTTELITLRWRGVSFRLGAVVTAEDVCSQSESAPITTETWCVLQRKWRASTVGDPAHPASWFRPARRIIVLTQQRGGMYRVAYAVVGDRCAFRRGLRH